MKIKLLAIVSLAIFFAGCEKADPYAKEKQAIQEYLTAHNYATAPTSSGLYYIETKTGTGLKPAYGSTVRVKYKGTFTDGTQFDAGTFDFVLGFGRVISGWDEGIAYMKEGGKAILIVPSDLAYGPNGYGDIPGYTPLVFEVELIDIF